jgi:hypothetical protein
VKACKIVKAIFSMRNRNLQLNFFARPQ